MTYLMVTSKHQTKADKTIESCAYKHTSAFSPCRRVVLVKNSYREPMRVHFRVEPGLAGGPRHCTHISHCRTREVLDPEQQKAASIMLKALQAYHQTDFPSEPTSHYEKECLEISGDMLKVLDSNPYDHEGAKRVVRRIYKLASESPPSE